MKLLMVLLLSATAFADPPINEDVKTRINSGYSFAPIVGYDPTFSVLLGAAAFRGETTGPYSNASMLLYGTLKKNVQFEAHYKEWDLENSFYNIDAGVGNFFDPYYGEGDRTSVDGRLDIDNLFSKVELSAGVRFDRRITFATYLYFRYRDENGVAGDTSRRIFGTEFRPAFGGTLSYDSRDNQIDSHTGLYAALSADTGPGLLSTKTNADTFGRAEADFRFFLPVTERIVLATQWRGGAIAGDAGVLYRFTLGGDDTLRGYPSKRFRGNFYYMGVLESRFQILSWLTPAVFVGAGDIADKTTHDFNGPVFTKGVGLRIGLPPDFVAKARLDFGFAQDQQSIYLSFNEAF